VKLAGLDLYRYHVPLSESVRLKQTTLRYREGLLVELASDEGATGWGEAAPLPGFSHESLDEVAGQLSHLAGSLVGREMTVDPEGAFARELNTLDLAPSARFGFTRGPSCSSRRCSAVSRGRCASRGSLRASGCGLS
jgi:O-succinylbenzoate synthase